MNTTTIGDHPPTTPEGMARAVNFPQLLLMDAPTGDGRLLDSAGAGVRQLPRTVYFQKTQEPGHLGAVAVGHLDEVTFTEDDDGQAYASGRGWLLDTPEAREAALFIQTKTLYHNSVDLNDVVVRFELIENEDDLELQLRFTEWRIGGTTLVGSPAFADAHAALDEETKASMAADTSELVVGSLDTVVNFEPDQPEVVAASGLVVAWADFHIPEPAHRQKIVVDDDGRVYGHLAIWDEPHEGYPNRLRYPPRPGDGYASFNQPGPLTEHGQVETGPIFLLGGHPDRPLGNGDPYKAYGGVENCWADVRVVPGTFGPWLSGRVRPGVDDTMLYAARASRVSGHWVGDRLRAITSCNVEGFPVGGSGVVGEAVIRDGEVLELVASYNGEHDDVVDSPVLWSEVDTLVQMMASRLSTTETVEVELEEAEGWSVEEVADAVVAKLRDEQIMSTVVTVNGSTTTGALTITPTVLAAAPTHHTGDTSSPWDAAANEKRLPSPMPRATANRFYAWIDTSAVENGELPKTGGKLPHHMVSGSTPGAANTHALAAAMAALHGSRGGVSIPEADRRGVYNHLAAHYRDAGMEPPDFDDLAAVALAADTATAHDLLDMELGLVE